MTGFMYCRPRGSWENIRVPLLHVWTLCLGKALRFENLLDGLELGRADGLRRCAAEAHRGTLGTPRTTIRAALRGAAGSLHLLIAGTL